MLPNRVRIGVQKYGAMILLRGWGVQPIDDRFYDLKLIPRRIKVRDAFWTGDSRDL